MTGFWQLLAEVLSPGAVDYIQSTGTFFSELNMNPSFAGMFRPISFFYVCHRRVGWGLQWVRMLQMSGNMSTIPDGMIRLIEAMHRRVCDSRQSDCIVLLYSCLPRKFLYLRVFG